MLSVFPGILICSIFLGNLHYPAGILIVLLCNIMLYIFVSSLRFSQNANEVSVI